MYTRLDWSLVDLHERVVDVVEFEVDMVAIKEVIMIAWLCDSNNYSAPISVLFPIS